MKAAPFAAGVCAIALVVGSPTRASIPGNLEELSNGGLLHVCRDVEPGHAKYVVCDEQVSVISWGSPYTGSECTAAGLEPVCKIDFIPGVRLPGHLALIVDDQPLDGLGDDNGNDQATMVLDLTFDWKVLTFIESFEGTKVGNWNPTDEFFLADASQEIPFTNSAQDAYQHTNGSIFEEGNLVELGLKVRDTAQLFFPGVDLTNAVPVLTNVVRDWNKGPVDASASGLASAGHFKVVVRFARVRP